MIFQHARFQIWNANQHPYRHTLNEMPYSNDATGSDVTTLQGALDWLFKVVYPQPQDPVATTAALPSVGNTLNDYRVVQDDGDGKAAGYRWEQREGDVSAKWYKVYDMDWGVDSVLSGFFRATQDHYVVKRGTDDIDSSGAFVTGTLAGQRIYGGASASTNLTLSANAGDGTGAQSGYVQFTDQIRPTTDGTIDLGTAGNRFRNLRLSSTLFIGTGGTLFSLDNDELSAGGDFTATAGGTLTLVGTTAVAVTGNTTVTGSLTATSLVTSGGSLTSSTGTVNLGTNNITTTTGYYQSGSMRLTTTGVTATGANESVVLTPTGSGVVSTGASMTVTGTVTAGALTVDATTLDGNTFTTTAANNLTFTPGGSIVFTKALTSVGITATGVVGVTGSITVDNLTLDDHTISVGTSNLLLGAASGGTVDITSTSIQPSADNARDSGATAKRWQTLYLGTSLSDGTNAITAATLTSLRDINTGVASGDTISWNGTKWVAVNYDTTIPHSGLTGLTSGDDHTQYALLAGRSGGQHLYGGTASGNSLHLHDNAVDTQSSTIEVYTGNFRPGFSNTDLGSSGAPWRRIFLAGEIRGAQLENFSTAGRPSASASTPGRIIWDTDLKDILVDIGGSWQQRSVDKYYNEDASGWNGSATSVSYTMPSDISDARKMVWQLKDNSNNFKVILADITHTGATNVTVTVGIALAAGTYTLIGVG